MSLKGVTMIKIERENRIYYLNKRHIESIVIDSEKHETQVNYESTSIVRIPFENKNKEQVIEELNDELSRMWVLLHA